MKSIHNVGYRENIHLMENEMTVITWYDDYQGQWYAESGEMDCNNKFTGHFLGVGKNEAEAMNNSLSQNESYRV